MINILIKTYDKLNIFLDRWLSGTIDLLIIESEAGLSKTHTAKERLKGIPHLFINSHVTPLENYKQLYEHRGELIWYDDVSLLLLNAIQVSLLKQVTDTHIKKVISYFTTSELIGNAPNKFVTMSRVLITCNKLDGENPHIKAIKDRGFFVKFEPTRKEILNKMNEVVTTYPLLEPSERQEVLQFIKQHSKHMKQLSLRCLVKGFQLYNYYKMKEICWKEDLLKELGLSEKLIAINQLLINYNTDEERLKSWSWSRASFYNYKSLIRA